MEEENLIPIEDKLAEFEQYLANNDRCIFSARFGDGKSYFLSKFIEKNKKKYLFIPIYPVNYQIAENKDIFEYIKRDILIRLLSYEEVRSLIDDEVYNNSILIYRFLQNNQKYIIESLVEILPKINIISTFQFDLSKIISKLFEIQKKFEESKENETDLLEKYITKFDNKENSIYEFDPISQLICDIINRYKEKHKTRKVVLIVEDLDRIDPEHIFRILNIFSAHFDRNNPSLIEWETTKGNNKFNFDKIITVCHFENIRNIYKHFYGEKTDFNGYIEKFSSNIPYKYSLIEYFKDYISTLLPVEINAFPKIAKALINCIVDKYKDKQELYGNIRTIKNKLNNLELGIREEDIKVLEKYSIRSKNQLTLFFVIIQRFELTIDDVLQKIDTNRSSALIEFDNLIGLCWVIIKNEKDFHFVLYSNILSVEILKNNVRNLGEVDIVVDRNIIEKVDIIRLFNSMQNRSFLEEFFHQNMWPVLKTFNEYLINSKDENIYFER